MEDEDDEGEDPDAVIDWFLRKLGLPPSAPGGWDDPTDEPWDE